MSPKMHPGKAVWIVAAAVIVAALILLTLFVTQTSHDRQESIVLPAAPNESAEDAIEGENNSDPQNDSFVVVTNENVATVLQTLNRPTAYHQSYTVTVGSDDKQHTKTVELWVNGSLLHAEVSDGQQRQSLITNGSIVHLWYDDAGPYISLELAQGTTAEDVLGLPDFGAYLELSSDAVTEADYLLLEEPQVQCIYVCTQEENGVMSHYWVNLDNGLLYQADVMENSSRVYSILQTGFDHLAVEDESFSDRFILPDGIAPFIEETKTPQP